MGANFSHTRHETPKLPCGTINSGALNEEADTPCRSPVLQLSPRRMRRAAPRVVAVWAVWAAPSGTCLIASGSAGSQGGPLETCKPAIRCRPWLGGTSPSRSDARYAGRCGPSAVCAWCARAASRLTSSSARTPVYRYSPRHPTRPPSPPRKSPARPRPHPTSSRRAPRRRGWCAGPWSCCPG